MSSDFERSCVVEAAVKVSPSSAYGRGFSDFEAEERSCVVEAMETSPGVEAEEIWYVESWSKSCGMSPDIEAEGRSCVVKVVRVPEGSSDVQLERGSCRVSSGFKAEKECCVVNVVGVSSGVEMEEGSWSVKTCGGSCGMLRGAKTGEGLSDVEVDVSSGFSFSILEGRGSSGLVYAVSVSSTYEFTNKDSHIASCGGLGVWE